MASLISIVIVLIVLGLVLYLLSTLPIDARIKQIINVVIVVAVIIWLLELLIGGRVVFHALLPNYLTLLA